MIAIRPLEPSDWAAFRDLRLTALRTEPGVFSASHEEAISRAPESWQRLLGNDRGKVFGLFDGARLVGITGLYATEEAPSVAILAMSFLLPEYRGRGLSRLFYKARLDWVRARGRFSAVVVSHRRSNEASRRANRRHGFLFTHAAPRAWPDGATEDELFYELRLPGPVPAL